MRSPSSTHPTGPRLGPADSGDASLGSYLLAIVNDLPTYVWSSKLNNRRISA
jgi:hypothetical protein